MRDLFEEIFAKQPLDPTEAARRAMRPQLRRRFYGRAEVAEGEGGFGVLLDGRPVKTPARRALAAPTRALAAALAAEAEKYLASDLVCYRAAGPEGLVARQAGAWDPIIAWARAALGARVVLAQGMVFVAQPDAALTAAGAALPRDPWRLGAFHAVTTLTGSALIALAVLNGRLTVEEAWQAAH